VRRHHDRWHRRHADPYQLATCQFGPWAHNLS